MNSLFRVVNNLPRKRADNHTRDHGIARPAQDQSAMEHCQGDESGEPEQARQSIEDEYDPFVEEGPVGFGAAAGEDGVEEEVGEGEEGEEGDEDEVRG